MPIPQNLRIQLSNLFINWAKEDVITFDLLPESGSIRKYYLITSESKKAIGAYNPDKRENNAFIKLTEHFYRLGLNVPQIYKENQDEDIYLIEYLGDTTLYSYLTEKRKDNSFTDELKKIYKDVLSELPKFQVIAGKEIDYSVCYPRRAFDKQSMMWDLNYFKYYFLKLAHINFDEETLENDFNTFADELLQADCNYFLYRDFQSRNIMINKNKLFFIDYQGGRKGALQYDIASLLYDAKADIPQEIRNELLEHYITELKKYINFEKEDFLKYYHGYSMIRIMQALGAYGYRGYYEKKGHFLQSIPYAIENLKYILNNLKLSVEIPALLDVLNTITLSENFNLQKSKSEFKSLNTELRVNIQSFSYKKNIPVDESGNGGGFVFDCRAINNPGRIDAFKNSTGKDKDVIEFLDKEEEMGSFLNNVFSLVDQSVKIYLQRGFTDLMVSFGCTGGQHRSVYCAERLTEHLKEKSKVKVILHHHEIEEI